MNISEKCFNDLKKNRLIALFSPNNVEECLTSYELFSSLGITLEVAFRTEYAEKGIAAICDRYDGALVLAGTVLTPQQAKSAINAGAAGIVSADYIPEVVDICIENEVMCVPGGLTDAGKQLVRKAEEMGCSLEELRTRYPYQWIYKLFPAFMGSRSMMEYAKAWKGPFRGLTVVYTGGITAANLNEAVKTDPEGIFCGSALTRNIHNPGRTRGDAEKWIHIVRGKPGISRVRVSRDAGSAPKRVVTFGEMMLRLSPEKGIRLKHTTAFQAFFGGAEANVASALAGFGMDTRFVTVFPENPIAENALGVLKAAGVDTQFILRKDGRMGIYYLEHGAGLRPSGVVYDRAHSAFSQIEPGDVDWEQVLDGADWFHWTGITPALGDNAASCLKEGLILAKEKGVTVSADLNYRKKLWTEDKARSVLSELMPYVDVLFGNEEDPIQVFGIKPEGTDVEKGRLNREGYQKLAAELVKMFGFKKVAISLRESISASENAWSACLYDGEKFFEGPRYHILIVDRVGSGDAFAAGLIYGFLTGKKDPEALSFGIAAACLKHSVFGDFVQASVEEVERIAQGKTGGRVQR
ncbi:MAG: hypothetical protein JXB26_13520 [Candidatus Aminicenantes bacterium]|nr:hypothetical protein [Candidatus Aminicenantes bacterium]